MYTALLLLPHYLRVMVYSCSEPNSKLLALLFVKPTTISCFGINQRRYYRKDINVSNSLSRDVKIKYKSKYFNVSSGFSRLLFIKEVPVNSHKISHQINWYILLVWNDYRLELFSNLSVKHQCYNETHVLQLNEIN